MFLMANRFYQKEVEWVLKLNWAINLKCVWDYRLLKHFTFLGQLILDINLWLGNKPRNGEKWNAKRVFFLLKYRQFRRFYDWNSLLKCLVIKKNYFWIVECFLEIRNCTVKKEREFTLSESIRVVKMKMVLITIAVV